MALISPGVEVSVINESQYVAAPTNSVPLIIVATAQNKSVPTTNQVAPGTTADTANEVYLITSQRDLVATFGTPFFYRTGAGTPIHGYELNEYGLMAAYSVLGVSNRAYIVRADVDLASLSASLTRPQGQPSNNTVWLDTAATKWGIFEWNQSNGVFTNRLPIVITEDSQTVSVGGLPLQSISVVGSYAVVTTNANNPVYYKNRSNQWVLIGSEEWSESLPVVTSTESDVDDLLTLDDTFIVNGQTITVNAGTMADLVDQINTFVTGVTAAIVNGRMALYASSTASSDGSTLDGAVGILPDSGNVLDVLGIEPKLYDGPMFQQSPHTMVPRWRTSDTTPRPSGSVWMKTTAVNEGVSFSLHRYSSLEGRFLPQTVGVYEFDSMANRAIDPAGGGTAIPIGTAYAQYDVAENNTATLKLFERTSSGATIISGGVANPTFEDGDQFEISVSVRTSTDMEPPVLVTINETTAADFASAFNGSGIDQISARVDEAGRIEITHSQGGVIKLRNVTGDPIGDAGFSTSLPGVRAGVLPGEFVLSAWELFSYTAAVNAPGNKPADGTLWYYSTTSEADIMINDAGGIDGPGWKGYRTVDADVRGYNLMATDPSGPIVSASAPSTQSDGTTALAFGDLWIDTSDLENYPVIYRWEDIVEDDPQWVRIDNSDQTSSSGIVFADARWSTDGLADPIDDEIPSINALLSSNTIDDDAPDYSLYPEGTLLFNTRRSGFNVKRYDRDQNTWSSVVGLRDDGSPYMGRKAVRQVILAAMRSAIDTNTDIREEQRGFNLIAAPGYSELIPNMIALNNERKNTAFIVGDTPFRLDDSGNSIMRWTNDGGADNLTSGDPYAAVFYPSCQASDLSGNTIVQPASHMMLRTMIRSDAIAYPWLAPAGSRRGIVDNARSLGYVEARTGEFKEIANRESVRDVLYSNRVNPITFIPGAGITNFGNKTLFEGSSMDRINVARLVAFLRGRLEAIGKQYLFEPNDQLTRNEVKGQIEQLMNDMIAKRAIYDYLVVVDESNNTPVRIDRNELWIDIAIEPVKSVEYVYIPVRLRNTGEISGSL